MVINELPAPSPITADDLVEIAIEQLSGVPSDAPDGFTRAYDRFVTFAILELEGEHSTDVRNFFNLGEDWSLPPENHELADWFYEYSWFELWSSPSGFSLLGTTGGRWEDCAKVLAKLVAHCSERAFALVESDIGDVIQSVAKTAQFCSTDGPYSVPITFLAAGDGGRVLRDCLDARFGIGSGKNDILERLEMATTCLVDADNASSPEGTISKSFAAIETLVCKRQDDKKTQTIGSFVPTLLQPTSLGRTRKGEVLKKLYGLRSRVVHGDSVDVSLDAAEEVRRVAAGVVRAVSSWRKHYIDMGWNDRTTWENFLDELRHASGDGKKVVGVDEDLSELLPDKEEK